MSNGRKSTAPMKPNGTTRTTLVEALSEDDSSHLRKYQALYVGRYSFLATLRYEFLTLFLSGMPGALGFASRKLLYRCLFERMGKGTVIGPYVTLRCPASVSLGNDTYVDSGALVDAKGSNSAIVTGNGVLIGSNAILSCASTAIMIGNGVSIGPACQVRAGLGAITIGDNVTIGSQTIIISGSPSYERLDIPMKSQTGKGEGIQIGNDVWIGVGARIIDGVKIGNGSVIGAGAVVVDDVPEYAIMAGVPARPIGNRQSGKVSV